MNHQRKVDGIPSCVHVMRWRQVDKPELHVTCVSEGHHTNVPRWFQCKRVSCGAHYRRCGTRCGRLGGRAQRRRRRSRPLRRRQPQSPRGRRRCWRPSRPASRWRPRSQLRQQQVWQQIGATSAFKRNAQQVQNCMKGMRKPGIREVSGRQAVLIQLVWASKPQNDTCENPSSHRRRSGSGEGSAGSERHQPASRQAGGRCGGAKEGLRRRACGHVEQGAAEEKAGAKIGTKKGGAVKGARRWRRGRCTARSSAGASCQTVRQFLSSLVLNAWLLSAASAVFVRTATPMTLYTIPICRR